jgi:hypothetical protein
MLNEIVCQQKKHRTFVSSLKCIIIETNIFDQNKMWLQVTQFYLNVKK